MYLQAVIIKMDYAFNLMDYISLHYRFLIKPDKPFILNNLIGLLK